MSPNVLLTLSFDLHARLEGFLERARARAEQERTLKASAAVRSRAHFLANAGKLKEANALLARELPPVTRAALVRRALERGLEVLEAEEAAANRAQPTPPPSAA